VGEFGEVKSFCGGNVFDRDVQDFFLLGAPRQGQNHLTLVKDT